MNRLSQTAAAGLAGAALLAAAACGAEEAPEEGSAAPDPAADLKAVATVEGATLSTSMGDIEVDLFPNEAPTTVRNFVDLAEGKKATDTTTGDDRFYDGTVFHRVIEDFMIQGGDPEGTGTGGPGYTFPDEIDPDLSFDAPGKLAMANSGPDTNGSQFFITTVPTDHLDGKHTIFGEVADGDSQEVADKISKVDRDAADKPVEDVVLESVTIHRSDD
ncbi:peptidyl-prolyl cis-trans isomerase A (cyclophilin A) [Nocardiopsis mwathae]|uniref:Peptidyl-prolyl cis-trans isomerase n=1 Tax=Nocardiopsis mwathae TaxID=1472723 RepID=A0A7W9YM91_9ACTN|nr:peptidylprolyl isomerase [Nocardiopsis mwathae]MBB6174585.1 peptidyl-prolyl cis-trans isomerase A (cyclophilin A) [Nocardiopsis mwathae]